jgi:ankyrin repeat protein
MDLYSYFSEKCAELLIDAGANVNAKNSITGATPLHSAIQSSKAPTKRVQIVRLLIERGKADSSITDFSGVVALDYCAEEDDVELKQLLQPRMPPLVKAILDSDIAMVDSLVKDKPSILESKFMSKSPLQITLEKLQSETSNSSHLKVLEILLYNGASIDEPREQIDEDSFLFKVCDAIKEAFISSDKPAIDSLSNCARLLHKFGAHLAPRTQQLMHDAARRGNADFFDFMTKDLLIDINTPGRQDMTPLHFAARSGRVEMVQHLLLTYPSINVMAKDNRGKTALDAARSNNKMDVISLLESYAGCEKTS